VSIILYGPGVMLASRHRGYPTVGTEGFPGNLAGNRQIETLIKGGRQVYACRFAMGALYGFREEDLIDGVQAFRPAGRSRLRPRRVARWCLPAQHVDRVTRALGGAARRAHGRQRRHPLPSGQEELR